MWGNTFELDLRKVPNLFNQSYMCDGAGGGSLSDKGWNHLDTVQLDVWLGVVACTRTL